MLPTQLYPQMEDELMASQLHKASIDLETLKLLNLPNRASLILDKFIDQGIIQKFNSIETLLTTTI